MTIAKRLECPRILSASIAILLLAAGLPAQSRYLGELDGNHSVALDYKRSGSCTFVNRVRDATFTFEPGTFDIFPPSAFSCQPFRFRDGRAVVNHPDVPVLVELSDPTAAPTVVNLSEPSNVTARITLMGRAQFRSGGDVHAVRIGVEVGLDPGARIARDQLTCSRQDDFVTDRQASRLIVADALCGVSVMDVVEDSVKMADVEGVMTVTEFAAEVESEFYIVMDHGSPDDGSSLGKGARLTYTVKSRYKFQLAEDTVVDPSPARSATEDQAGPQPPRSSAASEVEREVATDYTAPFRDSDSLGSGAPDGPGAGVGFMDLVAMLAEPIALFLGDAQLPDGESAEDLERARLHIDLLQILQDKSQGNLHHEEQTVLADLLYRLRMRYVQKKG